MKGINDNHSGQLPWDEMFRPARVRSAGKLF
jgi:hypothetical protein